MQKPSIFICYTERKQIYSFYMYTYIGKQEKIQKNLFKKKKGKKEKLISIDYTIPLAFVGSGNVKVKNVLVYSRCSTPLSSIISIGGPFFWFQLPEVGCTWLCYIERNLVHK